MSMQPFNYTLDVPDPSQALLRGVYQGMELNGLQRQQQQQEIALQKQQQLQKSLFDLGNNPNPRAEDYVAIANFLPKEQADSLRSSWEVLNKKQQQTSLNTASQAMAALRSGNPQIASQILKEQAEAHENSGDPETAQMYSTWSDLAKANPTVAQNSIGLLLAQIPGGDKVLSGLATMGKEQREQGEYPLGLEKKKIDIEKVKSDINVDKENSRIRAIEAQISREGNEIKREELQVKRDEMVAKRDEKLAEKDTAIDTSISNLENILQTVSRIEQTPLDVIDDATGPIDSKLLTLDEDTADFEELISNLDAQAFINQIPAFVGKGALSNAEGEKLSASLQSLKLRQSSSRLLENVGNIKKYMTKIKEWNIARKAGGAPSGRGATGTWEEGKSSGGYRSYGTQ